jgi:ubiquinone/menaquinone biosynthesis C-methylase UbiE
MAEQAPDRITWAVASLAVQPGDHLLEIGCGHGVAVSLVCEQLTHGKITALDRSQKMIDAATKRNQRYVDAGKATFICAALEEADFGEERFDKIFAIRVNFFMQQPERQLPILKRLLKPTGALYLIFDPPNASQSASFVEMATQGLQAYGFTVKEIISKQIRSVQGVCIVATNSRN